MLNTFRGGLCAGTLVSIGGAVFLAAENKTAGAVLFTVALLCICFKGYYLYTGKVGYLAFSHTSSDFRTLLTGLAGNLAITFALGLLIRSAMPALGEKAASVCSSKLTQNAFSTLVRGFFCGMLMYLAVSTYKEKDTVLGILFCVPVFILSGFEHSIADMFYFGASGILSCKAALFIILVIIGNSLGGVFLPLLMPSGDRNGK